MNSIFDSEEWADVPPEIFGLLSATVDSATSLDVLISTAQSLDPANPNFYYYRAVALQAGAILALQLAKENS